MAGIDLHLGWCAGGRFGGEVDGKVVEEGSVGDDGDDGGGDVELGFEARLDVLRVADDGVDAAVEAEEGSACGSRRYRAGAGRGR